jgi:hypothetical protein
MRRAALAGGGLVLLIGLVAVLIPSLTRDRASLTTTPQPPPLDAVTLIELRAGAEACLDRATIDQDAERAIVRVGTYGRPASPLQLTIDGPALHEVADIPPTYADSVPVSVPVEPPRASLLARVCLRNQGDRRVALFGAADRSSRSTTRVNGKQVTGNFEVAFAETEPRSLAARLPDVVDRLQGFRPDAPWLVWLLGVLFVVGVPAGAVWAVATSYPRRR